MISSTSEYVTYIYASNLKAKLEGHIAFGLFVHLCVHPFIRHA